MMHNSTFCAAAWAQVRVGSDGTFKMCCAARPHQSAWAGQKVFTIVDHSVAEWADSEYMAYVRQSLLAGVQIKECASCWDHERFGQRSLRQSVNKTITLEFSFEELARLKFIAPLYVEVFIGNACNYQCVMCDPESSSAFATHIKITPVQEHAATYSQPTIPSSKFTAVLDQVLNTTLGTVVLLGGELAYNQRVLKQLAALDDSKKSNIHLHIITNGSADLVQLAQQLGAYRCITYTVSVDGTGPTIEFIRVGSDWDLISAHLQTANKNFDVHCTVQAYNLTNLASLVRWAADHRYPFTYELLSNPSVYSVASIPLDKRQKIVDGLAADFDEGTYTSDVYGNQASFTNLLAHIMSVPYNEQYEQLLQQARVDSKNHPAGLSIFDIAPLLFD